MKELDVNAFSDFSDLEVVRRILMEDPVMRVVLVSLRAGQSLPEHAANGLVTVYSVGGRVLFYEGEECCDMVRGKLIRLAPGRPAPTGSQRGFAPTGHDDQTGRCLRLDRLGSTRASARSAPNSTGASPQHCF